MAKKNAECLRKVKRLHVWGKTNVRTVDTYYIHALLLCPGERVGSQTKTGTADHLDSLSDRLRAKNDCNPTRLPQLDGLVTSKSDLIDVSRVVNLAVLVRTPDSRPGLSDDVQTVLEQFGRGATVGVPLERRVFVFVHEDVEDEQFPFQDHDYLEDVEPGWFGDADDLFDDVRRAIDNVAGWETGHELPVTPGTHQRLNGNWCRELR